MQFKNIKAFSNGSRNIKEFYYAGNKIWPAYTEPQELIAGDYNAGFYGEVPASEFITGDELCSMVGITEGISQFSNEPWLKFAYLGDLVFVAKKPIRHSISWNHINEKGCVFGEKIVTIEGQRYKVTLLKTKTEGKQDVSSGYQGAILHNSMWNRLMGQIHEEAPSNWAYPDNMENTLVNWGINYTDEDLYTHGDYGNGFLSWCQEYGPNTNFRMTRGGYGVSYSYPGDPGSTSKDHSFRPALILVP